MPSLQHETNVRTGTLASSRITSAPGRLDSRVCCLPPLEAGDGATAHAPCNRHTARLWFTWRGSQSAGDDDGLTRRTQRHAARPARAQHSKRTTRQRRHVANDHGDPWTARLQGIQAPYRKPAWRQPEAVTTIGAVAQNR